MKHGEVDRLIRERQREVRPITIVRGRIGKTDSSSEPDPWCWAGSAERP